MLDTRAPVAVTATSTTTSSRSPGWTSTSGGTGMEQDGAFRVPGFAAPDVRTGYREHGPGLLGFAINELGDRGLAEELVQEVFVRAWRSGERYDPSRGSLRTWLFAIARNLVIDARRARSSRPTLALVTEHERALPDDFTAAVEARMQVHAALQELSDPHREVIVQVHLYGRTYAEVAARSGVPVATLRTRAYHGLRALRQTMESTGWTP